MFRMIVLIITALLFISCTDSNEPYTVKIKDGIKVIRNNYPSSSEELLIKPKKILSIEGIPKSVDDSLRIFTKPFALDIDSENYIYILDNYSCSVKKFDSKGNFVKSIGRKGSGPGEMSSSYCVALLKDTIFVENADNMRMEKFDTNGNYISNQPLVKSTPNFLTTIDNKYFISNNFEVKESDKGTFMGYQLVVMNSKFETINQINEVFQQAGTSEVNFLDMNNIFAVGNNEIFIAKNSSDQYRVDVMDLEGKPIYSIEKRYGRLEFAQYELDKLNLELKASYGEHISNNKAEYKKAINNLFFDKEGRLWVVSSQERDETNKNRFYADIFKDGILLGTISFDDIPSDDFFNINNQIYFRGDYIYNIDVNSSRVDVYEY